MSPTVIAIIAAVVSAIVFGVLGFVLGGIHRKKVGEAAIGSATQEADTNPTVAAPNVDTISCFDTCHSKLREPTWRLSMATERFFS